VLVADILCIGGIFPVCYGFLPVIHSWSFLHQSSMFRILDMLRAVSYTVAEDEWIFFLSLRIFSCVSWSSRCSSLGPYFAFLTEFDTFAGQLLHSGWR